MSFFGHKDLGYKVWLRDTDYRGRQTPTHAEIETDWTYGAPESSYKGLLFETRRKQEAIEFAAYVNTHSTFFYKYPGVKYHLGFRETISELGLRQRFETEHYIFQKDYYWKATPKDPFSKTINGLIEIIHRKNARIKYLERELEDVTYDRRKYELMMMDYFIGRGNQKMDYNKSMYDVYWDFMEAIYGEDQMEAHEDLCNRMKDDKPFHDYYNVKRCNH